MLVISRRTPLIGCGGGLRVDCEEADKLVDTLVLNEVPIDDNAAVWVDKLGEEANCPCKAAGSITGGSQPIALHTV